MEKYHVVSLTVFVDESDDLFCQSFFRTRLMDVGDVQCFKLYILHYAIKSVGMSDAWYRFYVQAFSGPGGYWYSGRSSVRAGNMSPDCSTTATTRYIATAELHM